MLAENREDSRKEPISRVAWVADLPIDRNKGVVGNAVRQKGQQLGGVPPQAAQICDPHKPHQASLQEPAHFPVLRTMLSRRTGQPEVVVPLNAPFRPSPLACKSCLTPLILGTTHVRLYLVGRALASIEDR